MATRRNRLQQTLQPVAQVGPVAIDARHGGHLPGHTRRPAPPSSSAGDDTRITVNLPARCKRASRRQSRLSVLTLSPADFGINDGAIIDLFIDRWDPLEFSRAVDTVVEAYRREGLGVILARRPRRSRLEATEPANGRAGAVDLAADVRGENRWRARLARSSPKQTR